MTRILLCILVWLNLSLSVHAGGRDDSRLITGARQGNIQLIETALGAGASIEAVDASGRTPLMWVAFRGVPDIVAYLIDQGAAVNARDARGRTALMWAAIAGRGDVVDILLRHGADAGLVDSDGTDAAGYAKTETHQHILDQLAVAATQGD